MTDILWRGKSVRTPQGGVLAIPYGDLAKAVQLEWDKTDKPDPKVMFLTGCAMSVIDIIATKRDIITSDIIRYIHGDVIYYFSDSDDDLIMHEHGLWDEWKIWAEAKLGTHAKTATGIMALEQSVDYYDSAMSVLSGEDDWHFQALQSFIVCTHSFILGYAVFCGELTCQRAIELSFGDALYQERHWGVDSQAAEERQALIFELEALQNYLHLLRN